MGKMRTQSRSMWRLAAIPAYIAAIVFCFTADSSAEKVKEKFHPRIDIPSIATPTFVHTGRAPLPAPSGILPPAPTQPSTVDPLVVEAGHVIRRLGFGPSKKELKIYLSKGFDNYINEQLNPDKIDDGKAFNKMPNVNEDIDKIYDSDMIRRWYIRMEWTRRVLQEKMTWYWHEHFSTSMEKVGTAGLMLDHEDLLRQYSLGNFRDFLIAMTKDQAMLLWLDNNGNNGSNYDCSGSSDDGRPNENYAREFLQLFSMGTTLLNLDGTPRLDGNNLPIAAYTEDDIDNVALTLTGYYVPYPRKRNNTTWLDSRHSVCDKTIFANDVDGPPITIVSGTTEAEHQMETEQIVDAILTRRADTIAAFISKELIQRFTTETPSPEYVQAVATAFRDSGWDIKEMVRTILTWKDANQAVEFLKPENQRSMHKEPVEYMIGAIRALNGKIKDEASLSWTYDMGQLAYWPPSVFSFYPPGNKGALVSTAYVLIRDRIANAYVQPASQYKKTFFAADKLISKFHLLTPEDAVSLVENKMLAAPIAEPNRTTLLNYMEGRVDEVKIQGLVWAVMCSPDWNRN
jgi:uncharacterized protein (DUF1800 family)